jgi:hypothetical protein
MGGYTPVGLGGALTSVNSTYGRRVGAQKRLGLLIGGSYDFNQRGTDDIEPAQGGANFTNTGAPVLSPTGMDVREYTFYRHRYGFVGSADYKLGENSALYFVDYSLSSLTMARIGSIRRPLVRSRAQPQR